MLALWFIVEFTKIYIAAFLILKINRKRSIKMLATVAIAFFLVVDISRFIFYEEIVMLTLEPYVAITITFVIMAYAVGIGKKILLLLGSYIFVTFINLLIAGLIVSAISITIYDVLSNIVYLKVINIAGILPLLLLAYFLRGVNVNRYIESLRKREIVLIGMIILTSGFSITLLQRQGDGTIAPTQVLNVMAIIGGIAIGGAVVLLTIKLGEVREIKRAKEMQDEMAKQERRYHESLLKQDRETRKFRHDINEHFQSIARLIQLGDILELEKYVSGLVGDYEVLKENLRTDTGSEIVNVILNDLELQYKDLGIRVEWEEAIPPQIKISINDITTLFSNLLKNAFEAVAKCEKRFIKVQTSTDGVNFYLLVENSCVEEVLVNGASIQSRKQDSLNHGYGLKIIDEIVKKYNGKRKSLSKENIYRVEIIFANIME